MFRIRKKINKVFTNFKTRYTRQFIEYAVTVKFYLDWFTFCCIAYSKISLLPRFILSDLHFVVSFTRKYCSCFVHTFLHILLYIVVYEWATTKRVTIKWKIQIEYKVKRYLKNLLRRRLLLRRKISVHGPHLSSLRVLLGRRINSIQYMTTRQNARRNFKVNRPKILPLLNGASRLWFALGPVNRQANEKAIAWYFSSSGFPSNSFLTMGSITFCFTSENGDSLTEPKFKRWVPGKIPRQMKTMT